MAAWFTFPTRVKFARLRHEFFLSAALVENALQVPSSMQDRDDLKRNGLRAIDDDVVWKPLDSPESHRK